MAKKKHDGPTAERFVGETLALIDERGGSHDVNLREVSRRVGCAHTNLYNYFVSFEDLRWAAFRRVLREYGAFLEHDLDDRLAPGEYLRRVITNLASYPEEHPGPYRFIASDPIDVERIPADVLETVGLMKRWLVDVIGACIQAEDDRIAQDAGDIVLSYVDGETLNLINGRTVPGEDVRGRIVGNALRLIALLGGDAAVDGKADREAQSPPTYPKLRFEVASEGG